MYPCFGRFQACTELEDEPTRLEAAWACMADVKRGIDRRANCSQDSFSDIASKPPGYNTIVRLSSLAPV
jgi:hypothetical protein